MDSRNAHNSLLTGLLLFAFILAVLFAVTAVTFAQDNPPRPGPDASPDSAEIPANDVGAALWQQTIQEDGYSVWRKEINSQCLYDDHAYTLDVPLDPTELSDISFTMSNWDVDYTSTDCLKGPEVDIMYWNQAELGILTGANQSWSVNSWPLAPAQMKKGANEIFIDTDAPGTACWCVGVGYLELRAKAGFNVLAQTPQKDERHRDFHKDKLDLTVTFSSAYDPDTLDDDSFKLEYRGFFGGWNEVSGTFKPLGPTQFRFEPAADLKDGIRYRVTVNNGSNGIKSTAGDELEESARWFFWTVPDLELLDAFDHGLGSLCPPAAVPCSGLELALFQVARNAPMVHGKDAVARLYLRWKEHDDVYSDDQVLEMDVDAEIEHGGKVYRMRQTVKRQDRYFISEAAAGANSINFRHTPESGPTGGSFDYNAQVIPVPQGNEETVQYTARRNPVDAGDAPRLSFNYFVLRDGSWAGGVPAAAAAEGLGVVSGGIQLLTDMFPVSASAYRPRGQHTIGYTYTGDLVDQEGCGLAAEVSCPNLSGAGSTDMPEMACVYIHMRTMKGPNRFVAVTVEEMCTDYLATAANDEVILLEYGGNLTGESLVHEAGHVYGISTVQEDEHGHRSNSEGVEGFQVRTMTNRSYVENKPKATSIMFAGPRPAGTQWIHNDDYEHLLSTVRVTGRSAAAASDTLLVHGRIDTQGATVDLEPGYRQELPEAPPSNSGTCTVALRSSSSVLSSRQVTPGLELFGIGADGEAVLSSAQAESAGPQPFAVNLPWNAAADNLHISCNGAPLLTFNRSANAPAVDFTDLANGATLSGERTISWNASDGDGDDLAYQLQFRGEGQSFFSPLMPLGPAKSMVVDTTALPSGDAMQFRVLATDGFNTAYATRTVSIENALAVLGVTPPDESESVSSSEIMSAFFGSDVDPATLNTGTFLLRHTLNEDIAGTISYDAASRTATFTPDAPLLPETRYSAILMPSVADSEGNILDAVYSWQFTTGPDESPPLVVKAAPGRSAADVPLNALVQVLFNEAMDASSLTSGALRLLNESGTAVPGSISYDPERNAALFIPGAPLAAGKTYTGQVTTAAKDVAGNALEGVFEWTFSSGSDLSADVRIAGGYNDQPFDVDGDGLYESLAVSADVEVLANGDYNLNARLVDRNGRLIGWATTGALTLARGVHTLTLQFDGEAIRSNGEDGPYVLDSINFYDTRDTKKAIVAFRAYQTQPYDVNNFFAVLAFNGIPDILLKWNTSRPNALNLRDFTFHAERPLTDVSYKLFVNTDPAIGLTIDQDDNLDLAPAANTEAESDVTIEATDPDGNRALAFFHVSVQRPGVTLLEVSGPDELAVGSSAAVDVQLRDQWGELFTGTAEVTFSATNGTVAPAKVTTSNGHAGAIFTAGSKSGQAFITAKSADVMENIAIQVVTKSGHALFLPITVRQ